MTQTPVAPAAERPHGVSAEQSASPEPVRPAGPPVRPVRASARPQPSSLRRTASAYLALTKPRIIELLLVTTVPAMVLAAGGLPHWSVVVVTMLAGTLAAGSANALNCYVDRDIDAVMRRTGHRPLARHDVSPGGALVFGAVLGAVAVVAMGLGANWLAGGLTAAAIAFYVVVYTMLLKRRTAQNIVWGGAAGCMPVLIGWAAVTDGLSWTPVLLFAIVFFWTPPHFWALAIRYREDYARAEVPMLPVVASPTRVAREIVVYSWLTVAATVAVWAVATGWLFGACAIVAGAVLLAGAHRLLWQTGRGLTTKPMQLFHMSNSYLAFIFVALAVDTFVR